MYSRCLYHQFGVGLGGRSTLAKDAVPTDPQCSPGHSLPSPLPGLSPAQTLATWSKFINASASSLSRTENGVCSFGGVWS